MEFAIGLIVGLVVGVAVMAVIFALRKKATQADREALDQQMRDTFSSLAATALDANSRQLTERSETTLDAKKQLIDQTLATMGERLNKLSENFSGKFGQMDELMRSLSPPISELNKILASKQRRGAWGERMAEDILRLAGLAENVNYVKQSGAEVEEGRPDFTFFLPNDLKVNMDVKFPLESYLAYLDADDDATRAEHAAKLARDVKGHVKDIAGRKYIDPERGTVSYVIVFLSSEQIYSLVLETNPDLIDEAMRRHVILAGPMTLYAMLAVIRQAAEDANIIKTADEVLSLLKEFKKQWTNYEIEFHTLGNRIEALRDQFVKVSTTRTNQLQRQMEKIEGLQKRQTLPPAGTELSDAGEREANF